MSQSDSNPTKPDSAREDMWETLPLYEKWQEIKKFFHTRRTVLDPTFETTFGEAGFDKRSIMNPWKFNLLQSGLASVPALAAIWIIHLVFETSDDTTLQHRISEAANDVFSATIVPLSLMIVVMIVRRACLKTQDQSLDNRRRAGAFYLYFDGALGFYSQMLAALAYVLWGGVDKISWFQPESQLQLAGLFYLSLIAFWIWQLLVTTRSVPRRVFQAMGYAPEIGETAAPETEGPWGKYRRAAMVSVPLVVFTMKLLGLACAFAFSEVAVWLLTRVRS